MKNYKVDFVKGTITLTKDFADRANILNSEEYKILRQLKKDFPNFTILRKTVKVNPTKESYKDLTFDHMELFIKTFDEETLPTYVDIKSYFKTATKSYYINVKSWFLAKYPDYRETEKAFEATIQLLDELEAKARKNINSPADEANTAETNNENQILPLAS